jgi:membrane-associated protein
MTAVVSEPSDSAQSPPMRPGLPNISARARSRGGLILAVALLVAGLFGTLVFGARTYGSFIVLRSAYELGLPSISNVRAWMTLGYISDTYGVELPRLAAALDLPPETSPTSALWAIADVHGQSRVAVVQAAQAAIAEARAAAPVASIPPVEPQDDAFLAALLAYSYPALGLILLLGAIGAPVPTGFATVLAGALSAGGSMSWPAATATAVIASVAGDGVGYAIGRLANEGFIARYGRFAGYAGGRKARIEALFLRWGGVTVLLTRTLVSHLSSVASLLAGLSRYAFVSFMIFAAVGRVLWTAAYFGAGYVVGTDVEASAGLLTNVTGVIIAASVAAFAASLLVRRQRRPA